MPNFHPLAPEEVIQEIIRHLGGLGDNAGRRVWLAEHHKQFDKSLGAVALARRRAMFEALDGQFGKAVYALAQPAAECLERLATVTDIADDSLAEEERREGFTGSRVWFAGSADRERQQMGDECGVSPGSPHEAGPILSMTSLRRRKAGVQGGSK